MIYKNLLKASAFATALALSPFSNANDNETLVFVHGAHFTGDSWSRVTDALKQQSFKTLSVNLPGRGSSSKSANVTLASSSQALCNDIKAIDGNITFVAHSQGGAVVNHALSLCPSTSINRIIYIAAVAPLNGTTPFSLLSKADETHYFKGVSFDEASGWMNISDQDAFVATFSETSSTKLKSLIIDQAVNEPAATGEGVVQYDSNFYKNIDVYYIHTKQDHIISYESQKNIAASIKPIKKVTLDTGHLPMVTTPKAVANTIIEFTQS